MNNIHSSTNSNLPQNSLEIESDNERGGLINRSLKYETLIGRSSHGVEITFNQICNSLQMRSARRGFEKLSTITKGELDTATSLALFEGWDQVQWIKHVDAEFPSAYSEALHTGFKRLNGFNCINEIGHTVYEALNMERGTDCTWQVCCGTFVPRALSFIPSLLVVSSDDGDSKLLAVEPILALRDILLACHQGRKLGNSDYYNFMTNVLAVLYMLRALCLTLYTGFNVSDANGSSSGLEHKVNTALAIQIASLFLLVTEHIINGYEYRLNEERPAARPNSQLLDQGIQDQNTEQETQNQEDVDMEQGEVNNYTISVLDMEALGLFDFLNNESEKYPVFSQDLRGSQTLSPMLSDDEQFHMDNIRQNHTFTKIPVSDLANLLRSNQMLENRLEAFCGLKEEVVQKELSRIGLYDNYRGMIENDTQ